MLLIRPHKSGREQRLGTRTVESGCRRNGLPSCPNVHRHGNICLGREMARKFFRLGLCASWCSMALVLPVALLLASSICQARAQNGTANVSGCQADALAQHNFLRSMHQAPALQWNDMLARAAQSWATKLAASGCSLTLESNITGGENLWSMSADNKSSKLCSHATLGWYIQGLNWRFSGSNTPISDNAQLLGTAYPFIYTVWSSIQKLGCGAAQGLNGCWAVVCRYPAAILAPQLTPEVEAAYLANIKAPVAPANLSSTADQQQCQQAALAKINAYRADHGAQPLTWNASLAEHSLVLAASAANNKCNTSWLGPSTGWDAFSIPGSGANSTCGQAVVSFYDAGSTQFNFTPTPWADNNATYEQWHSFTQMIWRNTTQVGCGSAQGPTGCWVVICRYDPPGNVQSDSAFLQNVLPAVSTSDLTRNSSSNGNSNSSSSSSQSSGRKSTSIVVGACVASGFVIIALAGILYWYCRRRWRTWKADGGWFQTETVARSPLVNHGTRHTAGYPGQSDSSNIKYPAFSVPPSFSHGTRIMTIPGLMAGEPFTRGTAFAYSWTGSHSLKSGVAKAVEHGLTDLQLDTMVQGSSNEVQDCPVVCLSKEQVREQLQLLTHGLRGRGGAALVFKALWPSRFGPDALLAVKVLKDGYDCNPYVLESFAHEASVLASVRHPNVVKLYGYCLDPPNVCLIMELLPCSLKEVLYGGTTATANTSDTSTSSVGAGVAALSSDVDGPSEFVSVQSSLKVGVPLTMSQTLQVSTQIAAGLAYLHDQPEQVSVDQARTATSALDGEATGVHDLEQGTGSTQKIVHRDLKPANILINSVGQVKISDFGLARRHDSTTIDTRHVGAGTLPYQAPEILSGSRAAAFGLKATNRCDVYSMAMIFWELLSRQPPWRGLNEVGILSQVLNGKRPTLPAGENAICQADTALDLTQLPASLTALPAYNDIIRQCWAQRDLRRPTAAEAHRLLMELQQKYQIAGNS